MAKTVGSKKSLSNDNTLCDLMNRFEKKLSNEKIFFIHTGTNIYCFVPQAKG